ncbi:MAG TPA: DUF1490 domain-containing protein [Candidatus Anaerotignum merdipullorum]|nr:DUF1490 domain-containing protein [Candidatus Anaerotignum merdipullorum]
MWKDCLKCDRVWVFVGGMAAAIIGKKVIQSKKTREICVKTVAQAMKLQKDAQTAFANVKEEAEDICFDAKKQAEDACDCEQ